MTVVGASAVVPHEDDCHDGCVRHRRRSRRVRAIVSGRRRRRGRSPAALPRLPLGPGVPAPRRIAHRLGSEPTRCRLQHHRQIRHASPCARPVAQPPLRSPPRLRSSRVAIRVCKRESARPTATAAPSGSSGRRTATCARPRSLQFSEEAVFSEMSCIDVILFVMCVLLLRPLH